MTIKIIIVDDHHILVEGIKSILQTEIAIDVIGEAHNGLELFKMLVKGTIPDIVLMDIQMPIMNGITTTQSLKSEYPNIPVLALSMFDQEADIIEMLDAGAKGYIVKNSSKEELIGAIYAVYQQQEYFSAALKTKVDAYRKRSTPQIRKILTRREKEILRSLAKGEPHYK